MTLRHAKFLGYGLPLAAVAALALGSVAWCG